MDTNTTRRGLLRLGTSAAADAAGAAILTGGVALASEAKGAEADRAAWERAVEAFHAAERASDDHWRLVEEPARAELQRRAPGPHMTFTVPALSGRSATFRIDPQNRDAFEDAGGALRDGAREAFARYDAWEAAADALGVEAIGEQSDAHLEAITEAENSLFAQPAPDVAAVAFKLDLLWRNERDPIPGLQEMVLADLRRLSGGEA